MILVCYKRLWYDYDTIGDSSPIEKMLQINTKLSSDKILHKYYSYLEDNFIKPYKEQYKENINKYGEFRRDKYRKQAMKNSQDLYTWILSNFKAKELKFEEIR